MKRIYTLLFAILICLPAFADEEKLKVAVFDPTSSGTAIDEGTKVAVREIISSTIVNTELYNIVERSMLEKVMQEQRFAQSGVVDDNDAVEIGKISGASKVVVSVVTLTGGRNMLSVKLIDVKTGLVDKQKVKVSSGELLDVVEPLTLELMGFEDVNSGKTVVSASAPASVPASVPTNVTNPEPSKSNGSFINRMLKGKNNETQKTSSKESPQASAASVSAASGNFSGCGITFTPAGYTVKPQPNEMNPMNMDRVLYGSSDINVVIDFSEALVTGRNIVDFIESSLDAKTFNTFDYELERLLKGLNKEVKGYRFIYYPSSTVTLLVKVRNVDAKGRENTSDFVLVDTETHEVLSGMRITSEGGRSGSFPNLIGDAFEEDAAPKFIDQFKSALKKAKKKRK